MFNGNILEVFAGGKFMAGEMAKCIRKKKKKQREGKQRILHCCLFLSVLVKWKVKEKQIQTSRTTLLWQVISSQKDRDVSLKG